MIKQVFKTMVAVLAIAAAATGPAWGQNSNVSWVLTPYGDLQNGDTVVIVDQSSERAMTNNGGTSVPPSAVVIEMSGDQNALTEVPDATLKWVVVLNNGNYQFRKPGTDDQFLYCNNSNNGVRVGDNSANQFTFGNGGANYVPFLKNTSNNRYIGVYDNLEWRCYTTTSANISNTVTGFYVRTVAAPPVPHTVRFAAGNDGWTVQDVTASASAEAPAVLSGVMAGDSLVVTAPASLPRKVKSVKAVKYVAPVPVQSIVLNKQTAYLAKDNTMTLSATVLPENAADKSYSWSSDDIGVADVDQNGVVTGHNPGTANIIATANDGSGVKDTCVVTVLSPIILDGVTVLYASDEDNWSTVIGYNPGLMYQEHGDVRLTSNGAFLYYDVSRVYVTDLINPVSLEYYQWMRKVVIHGSEFYYHQSETWQQAISANRQYNEPWSINNGKVIFSGEWMLVDANWEPVDPTATIDPSTVNYNLELIMEN